MITDRIGLHLVLLLLLIVSLDWPQIVFEGVRGSDYAGDIAIDDISLQSGKCAATIDCDFENPYSQLCAWKNIKTDKMDWRLGQGKTSSLNTGPSNDHTLGDGRGRATKLTNTTKSQILHTARCNVYDEAARGI